MRLHGISLAVLLVLTHHDASAGILPPLVDTFDNQTNPNGWSFGVSVPDILQPSGGNPKGWMNNPLVIGPMPVASAGMPENFRLTQAIRRREVNRIAIDARTISSDFERNAPFTLMIKSTKGTSSPQDDDFVYTYSGVAPRVRDGWVRFSFNVPSKYFGYLPPSWIGGRYDDFRNFRPGANWNTTLASADVIQFWWGDPAGYYIFQTWNVGVDNIVLERGL